MDLDSLPACALNRSVGTVIVRIRMEENCCGCRTGRPAPAYIHSGCELCYRTRLISKHNSDCDSVVEKCRPYRSSAARSRYVDVCLAVCLLLLVGLSPQSSAAPHRSRTMDRQRRALDNKIRDLWENPCDYSSNSKSEISSLNTKELAQQLSTEAKLAFGRATTYKRDFASELYSYSSFEDLVKSYDTDTYEWLRKQPFYREEVLPKEKTLYAPVSDEYLNELMKKMNNPDDVILPAMYKSLKVVVAGLHAFSNDGLNANIISHQTLKENVTNTMHDVRAVLCLMSDVMRARNHEIMPLLDSEIPDFKKHDIGLPFFRDTLNYLEYIAQVFEKFHKTVPA